ncbi:MAG: C-GCAxxG-C-C family protein [Kiritimatiellae bacterium]|nr:C-GCAxxG-C-C family protein [Kiritimatiellia bacterium]
MNRRTALKVVTSGLIGGVGVSILTTALKPEIPPQGKQKKLDLNAADPKWIYHKLVPEITADIAYNNYSAGSCMYAAVKSVISQLAETHGEPFASFPVHMMKYGHSGVGGYGTLCGALNGSASLIGLFVDDKKIRDALIKDLFRWYENTALPVFQPNKPILDFTPPKSICKSPLCHASTTCWANAAGCRVDSKERSERCKRLTADVAAKLVTMLNKLVDNSYMTESVDDQATHTCITCHGTEGKVANSSTKMNCNSCHTKSVGHKLFGDIHYKFMDKRE